jgi:hypothetical protein
LPRNVIALCLPISGFRTSQNRVRHDFDVVHKDSMVNHHLRRHLQSDLRPTFLLDDLEELPVLVGDEFECSDHEVSIVMCKSRPNLTAEVILDD